MSLVLNGALAFFWRVQNPKIEDKQVPGIYIYIIYLHLPGHPQPFPCTTSNPCGLAGRWQGAKSEAFHPDVPLEWRSHPCTKESTPTLRTKRTVLSQMFGRSGVVCSSVFFFGGGGRFLKQNIAGLEKGI